MATGRDLRVALGGAASGVLLCAVLGADLQKVFRRFPPGRLVRRNRRKKSAGGRASSSTDGSRGEGEEEEMDGSSSSASAPRAQRLLMRQKSMSRSNQELSKLMGAATTQAKRREAASRYIASEYGDVAGTFGAHNKVVLAMVGLPARGKSYIVKMLVRYLEWIGFPTRIFNVGDMRRRRGMAGASADFFKSGEEPRRLREELAMACQEEMYAWLDAEPSSCVAIFDATNTTKVRRATLAARAKRAPNGVTLIFIESICDKREILDHNYRMKLQNADYKDRNPEDALADFTQRVREYERRYETVEDDEDGGQIAYIKIINVGEKVIFRQCSGYLASQISFFLGNVHITPRKIWLALHAECTEQREGIVGASAGGKLTRYGRAFAVALARFVSTKHAAFVDEHADEVAAADAADLLVLIGNAHTHKATIQPLLEENAFEPLSGGGSGGLDANYAAGVAEYAPKNDDAASEQQNPALKHDLLSPLRSPSRVAFNDIPEHASAPAENDDAAFFRGGPDREKTTQNGSGGSSSSANAAAHTGKKPASRAATNGAPTTSRHDATTRRKIEASVLSTSLLNELCGGDFDGISRDELEARYPGVWQARNADKLRFRYPGAGGESYVDVIARLRPILIELERQRKSVLIVSHLAVQRCLYAYFLGTPAAQIPYLQIPTSAVVELTPTPHGTTANVHVLVNPGARPLVDGLEGSTISPRPGHRVGIAQYARSFGDLAAAAAAGFAVSSNPNTPEKHLLSPDADLHYDASLRPPPVRSQRSLS